MRDGLTGWPTAPDHGVASLADAPGPAGRESDHALCHARGRGGGGERRQLQGRGGRERGRGRRVRLGQDPGLSLAHGAARQERPLHRQRPLWRPGALEPAGQGAEPDPRRPARDDLPGPDDLAQSVPSDLAPDDRGADRAQGHERAGRARRERAAARSGGDSGGAEPDRSVPARVLRRHAPAGDDRDRAALPAGSR